MGMIESWRWYGPLDQISLPEIRQTGATGIVTALHEIPYGEVWPAETVADRVKTIAAAGMAWVVCESLPLHEDIKRGTGDLARLFENYRQSMANLAASGVRTICYNFMPVLDWTRTDLKAPVANGGTCLRFDAARMAAFEIHMLGREAAVDDYPADVVDRAKMWFEKSSKGDQDTLLSSIMSGLPGAFDRYDIEGLRAVLRTYEGVTANDVRANYKRFLDEVMPAAEDLGMVFCVHPDDPPRDILGLPRVVSDAADIDWIMGASASATNGLTLCSGSLGANPDNDVVAIARKHASRIHFAHLRNVRKEADGSFEEAEHLTGDTDMVALAKVLSDETGRRDKAVPYRPDHGHELLDDAARGTFPGYPVTGRLRGLAELRGVFAALQHGQS